MTIADGRGAALPPAVRLSGSNGKAGRTGMANLLHRIRFIIGALRC